MNKNVGLIILNLLGLLVMGCNNGGGSGSGGGAAPTYTMMNGLCYQNGTTVVANNLCTANNGYYWGPNGQCLGPGGVPAQNPQLCQQQQQQGYYWGQNGQCIGPGGVPAQNPQMCQQQQQQGYYNQQQGYPYNQYQQQGYPYSQYPYQGGYQGGGYNQQQCYYYYGQYRCF